MVAWIVYDGTKAHAGVIAAAKITEADLSLPPRGLAWIATLLLLNTARTLSDPYRTYRLPRNAMSVPLSVTILLQLFVVEVKSPCILDMLNFILTYNSASCGNNPTSSTKLATRTGSAHCLNSVR